MCKYLLNNYLVRGLVAATVALWAGASAAVPQPFAPATSDGDYTVTYTPCSDCAAYWLEEQGADGVWRGVPSHGIFEDRAEGIYRYRVAYEYVDYVLYEIWRDYSASIAVEVVRQPRLWPALSEQLRHRYDARFGDFDADGVTDLFVERPGGKSGGDGTLGPTLLRGLASGAFEPRAVSGAAVSSVRAWPLADVGMESRDLNIDGFADLVLTGLAALPGSSGKQDQILFAPGTAGANARIRAVDAGLARFGRDIRGYLQDPDYFPDNAEVRLTFWTYMVWTCTYGSPYDDPLFATMVGGCIYVPIQQVYVYYDYSRFAPAAVDIWQSEDRLRRSQVSPDTAYTEIETLLEVLLEVELGGWDIRDLLGEQTDELDQASRRGTELFSVLAGIASAQADELPGAEDGGTGAANDNVLLAGRRILGFGPFHTALEYAGSTISASDSDTRALFDGTLVSLVDWSADHPALTLKIAVVTSALTPALYWGRLRAADAGYDDDLRYDAIPSLGAGGYNSNSYTSGIINATNGVAGVPMTRFVGGELPVPPGEFF